MYGSPLNPDPETSSPQTETQDPDSKPPTRRATRSEGAAPCRHPAGVDHRLDPDTLSVRVCG